MYQATFVADRNENCSTNC